LTGTLSFAAEVGWGSPAVAFGLGVAALSLVALAFRLARARDPLVDPALFRNRVFASASASLLLAFMATFAVSFLMPFYLEQLRGWTPQRAGLLLTPLPLTIAVIAPATGALADRIGTRRLASTGMGLAAAGLALLTQIEVTTPVPKLVLVLSLIGVGQATFQPPNSSALMGAAPRERQGIAGGILATGRVVGQSLSVAIAGAVFAAVRGSAAPGRGSARALLSGEAIAPFLDGIHAAFLGCALLALASSVVALVRGREDVPRADVARARS
jgi:MFS family permease